MVATLVTNKDSPHTSFWAFQPTRTPSEGQACLRRMMGYYYTYSDISASKVKVNVPPNSRVLSVHHEVHTAFTGVTAMIVGDDDDDDGWIETGVISPTASDPEFVHDYDAAFMQTGKLYEDGDTIDISMTGIALAGAGMLWVEIISYNEAANAEA